MKKNIVDFHIHTLNSDGEYDIQNILEKLKQNEVSYMSITDHDFINFDDNFDINGISVINGIEFTSEINNQTIHILGYGIKRTNEIVNLASKIRKLHKNKTMRLVYYLNKKLGISSCRIKGGSIDFIDICQTLIDLGMATNSEDAMENILKPIIDNINLKYINAKEVIECIRRSGGISILAHPYRSITNECEMVSIISKLCEIGLDGIEVFYSEHLNSQIENLKYLSDKFDLVSIGGSDFHGGVNGQNIDNLLGIEIDNKVLQKFLDKMEYRRRNNFNEIKK